jgi:hypothetical protein
MLTAATTSECTTIETTVNERRIRTSCVGSSRERGVVV